jgi:hypothetical protein
MKGGLEHSARSAMSDGGITPEALLSFDPAWRLGWKLFLALNLATFGMNAIAQETRASLVECLSQKPSTMCQNIE